MNLQPNGIYHIYNRGNNKQTIFFSDRNYLFFKKKITHQLTGVVELLAYCLMPNHFHLMVSTNGDFDNDLFTKQYRILLSSYTRAINKQEKRIGSLFQQKSKSKEITDNDYAITCFNYIHFNPVKAHLCQHMDEWRHSSYNEFSGHKEQLFCNVELARKLLALPLKVDKLQSFSNVLLPDNYRELIF